MIENVERYLELRAQLGYKDSDLRRELRRFAAFAAERGATHLRNVDVLAWVECVESTAVRRRRFDWLSRMGAFLRAEDGGHELIPPRYSSRLGRRGRLIPFFYQPEDIVQIMDEFVSLELPHPYDALTYRAIIGLISATGMRISEALNLQLTDVRKSEISIRETKFNKSRLLYVDESTTRAIDGYLCARPLALNAPKLFIIRTNRTPSKAVVDAVFRRCTKRLGIKGKGGSGIPRIHDLRHTFAINSLAECAHDEKLVANHIVALSTYLGHVSVRSTYWYLSLLPKTKLAIVSAMEELRHAQSDA